MNGVELVHPQLEQRMDAFLAERGNSWRQLQRGDLSFGGKPISVDELQYYLIDADPVIWAELNFIDRDSLEPWRLFGYQQVAARYLSDAIFECGAETGKTRDIVLLSTWLGLGKGPRQRGDILIAGALDGNLDDIHDEQIFQLENNPVIHAAVDWEKSKVKPYKKLVFKNGNRIYYRPAGNDGRAFRGVHVGLAAFFDEAAKAHEKRIFAEFWRALKPSAFARIYSVPDGVTDTEFFRLCRRSRAVDPNGRDLPKATPGVDVVDLGAADETLARRDRSFVKFRWPKTLMPPPFWTEERKRGYVEQYGGIDSSDYRQNVLGEWGDPARTVFPWERFSRCLRFNADFRELTLVCNSSEGVVVAAASRLDPGYEVNRRPGDAPAEDEAGGSAQPFLPMFEEEISLAGFDLETIRALVARTFAPLGGHLVAGMDCGNDPDPSVIHVYAVVGRRKRLVARIELRRFDYPLQVTVVRAIDELLAPDMGWGLDASGVGTAVEQYLTKGEDDWSLADRLTGYIANAKVPSQNPDTGETIVDEKTEKSRMVTTKELGTSLLELDIQRLDLELVPAPELTKQFPQYRSRKTASGERVFDKTNDHDVDAARVALLRRMGMDFSAPVDVTYAVPSGMSRPPLEIDL